MQNNKVHFSRGIGFDIDIEVDLYIHKLYMYQYCIYLDLYM